MEMQSMAPLTDNRTELPNDTTRLTQQQRENIHEDEMSVSSYVDLSSNDLTIWPGAMLIVADCMGTGILALPRDLKVLGPFGIFFLVLNLPINYYAGSILHKAACSIETRLNDEKSRNHGNNLGSTGEINAWDYDDDSEQILSKEPEVHEHHHYGIDTPHTFDFIGVTYAFFDHFENKSASSKISFATIIVTTIYYVNIFLVLGNYILVMSHSVAAIVGEDKICLPAAGVIASTLMFGISQLKTMAMLGRSASVISLTSLAIVVIQCLSAIQRGHEKFSYNDQNEEMAKADLSTWQLMVSQLAAISSIGFAVGSQKLLLNIRHEFADRNDSPKSLGIALGGFGTVYLLTCFLAGDDPPSFLFNAISSGIERRIAGLLLWIHVAVSFAINSQALCSSLDRLKFHRVSIFGLDKKHTLRWATLTLLVGITAYFIANAVPFFKDLVALIGALTSVPLTLLLPGIYHRKAQGLPLFCLDSGSIGDITSLSLIIFSCIFLICGVIGSISSIQADWADHGPPFACH